MRDPLNISPVLKALLPKVTGKLPMDVRFQMHAERLPDDRVTLRAEQFRVDGHGDMVRNSWRMATATIDAWWWKHGAPGRIIEDVQTEMQRLFRALNPPPLPRFRIRTRGPNRLRAAS